MTQNGINTELVKNSNVPGSAGKTPEGDVETWPAQRDFNKVFICKCLTQYVAQKTAK